MTQLLSFPDRSGQGGPAVPAGGMPDPTKATLSEVWAPASNPAATAFALSAMVRPGPVLWVQDRLSAKEAGVPYAPAINREIIHVRVSRVHDALAAMEMALNCPALGGVLGEIWGEAARLDFTATKRLAMRAEAGGVPCWLLRRAAAPGLSAARDRWRIASLPSAAEPWDDRAPGAPRWRAELFRSRGSRPGLWVARNEQRGQDGRAQNRLAFTALAGDGAVDGDTGAQSGHAAR